MRFYPFYSVYLFHVVFCPFSLLPPRFACMYACMYVYTTHVSLFSFRFLLSHSFPCGGAAVGPLRVELSALINRVPMVILAIPPKTNNRRMFICAPSTDPDPCSQSEAPPCLLPQHCLCSSARSQFHHIKTCF